MVEHIESEKLEQYAHIAAFNESSAEVIEEAAMARDHLAVSHRGFLVGSACLGYKLDKNGRGKYEIHSAGNFTPVHRSAEEKKDPNAKWCSERTVGNIAIRENITFIPGMVSVSTEVDRGEGGTIHDVLHPCPECRVFLRHLIDEGLMSRESRLISVNDRDKKKPIVRNSSLGEILDLYNDKE